MYLDVTGWKLNVFLPPALHVSVQRICPEYSLDGIQFVSARTKLGEPLVWENEGDYEDDEDYRQQLNAGEEPVKSFLANVYDRFYFRMRLETAEESAYSEVHLIERTRTPQTIPNDATVFSLLPPTMEVKTMRPPSRRGLYNVTVREGSTTETAQSYLPEQLIVNTQIQVPVNPPSYPGATDIYAYGSTAFYAQWNLPTGALTTGVIKNGVQLTPPSGELLLQTTMANYRIPSVPTVQILVPDPNQSGEFIWEEEPFDLSLHVIPAEERIAPQLGMYWYDAFEQEVLAFSLPFKPSGAKNMVAEYSLDGGESWKRVERAAGNDLVALGYAADMVPKQKDYAAPLFFDNDKTPMKEFLADNTKGFLVRLNIEGGVYDGVSEALPWPMEYQFNPPTHIDPGGDGGDGNRGDAGAGGDTGNDNGQRPDLPEQEETVNDDVSVTVSATQPAGGATVTEKQEPLYQVLDDPELSAGVDTAEKVEDTSTLPEQDTTPAMAGSPPERKLDDSESTRQKLLLAATALTLSAAVVVVGVRLKKT